MSARIRAMLVVLAATGIAAIAGESGWGPF